MKLLKKIAGKIALLLFAMMVFPTPLWSQVLASGFAFDDPTTSYTISLDASLATPLLNIESSYDGWTTNVAYRADDVLGEGAYDYFINPTGKGSIVPFASHHFAVLSYFHGPTEVTIIDSFSTHTLANIYGFNLGFLCESSGKIAYADTKGRITVNSVQILPDVVTSQSITQKVEPYVPGVTVLDTTTSSMELKSNICWLGSNSLVIVASDTSVTTGSFLQRIDGLDKVAFLGKIQGSITSADLTITTQSLTDDQATSYAVLFSRQIFGGISNLPGLSEIENWP